MTPPSPALAPADWVSAYCTTVIPPANTAEALLPLPKTPWNEAAVGTADAYASALAAVYRAASHADATPIGGDLHAMQSWLSLASAWDQWVAGMLEDVRSQMKQAPTPADAQAVWARLAGGIGPAPAGVIDPALIAAVQTGRDQIVRESAELEAYVRTNPGCPEAHAMVLPAPY